MKNSGTFRVIKSLSVFFTVTATLLVGALRAHAQTVVGEPAGFYKVQIAPGANIITAPMHQVSDYRGAVSSATSNSVTVAGNPNWVVNQFGPRDGYDQFILVVRNTLNTNTPTGDWWPILSNTSNKVTVANSWQNLSGLAANDQLEIRHLTSFKDLFGTGSTCILIKDNNGNISAQEEDIVRFTVGTGFNKTIFYHNGAAGPGTEGYYVDDQGPFDGSTITITPGQAIVFLRKVGSPAVDIVAIGQVQTTKLTHYLQPGANIVGSLFPADSPIGSSGLVESGWIADTDGNVSATQEDILRPVVGTSFTDVIFYHNSGNAVGPTGWYINDTLNNNYPLISGKAYVFSVKGPASRVWRQNVPFTP